MLHLWYVLETQVYFVWIRGYIILDIVEAPVNYKHQVKLATTKMQVLHLSRYFGIECGPPTALNIIVAKLWLLSNK